MFSSKLRGFLYGVLITTSLVSVITYASTHPDGVFGDYFDNIIQDAAGCGVNTAITGFDTAPANFGKQECTTFDNIVRTVLGVGNVGIGTNTPTTTLSVSGSFSLTDGTQGNGKVLTSDASGNASWQNASGGGGGGGIWENVPLTDTNDYNVTCEYRYKLRYTVADANQNWANSTYSWAYPSTIQPKYLGQTLSLPNYYGVPSTDKANYYYRDNLGNQALAPNLVIDIMEKRCSGGGGGGGKFEITDSTTRTYYDITFDSVSWDGNRGTPYACSATECRYMDTLAHDYCTITTIAGGAPHIYLGYLGGKKYRLHNMMYSNMSTQIGVTCYDNIGGGGGLGYSQTWQDMTTSRVLGTTYTNTTGKPISIQVIGGAPVNGASNATLIVDGIEVDYYTTNAYNGTLRGIIPPGSTYLINGSNWSFNLGSPYGWKELR